MILFYPRRKRHFGGHATRNGSHPCYIVGETSSTYLYFGLTHARKKGKGHANYRLSVNPKKGDPSTACLRKALCEDEKRRFTLMPYANYEIADEDDDCVDGLLKKRKK